MIDVLNCQEDFTSTATTDRSDQEGVVEVTENTIYVCYFSMFNEDMESFNNFWKSYPIDDSEHAKMLLEKAAEQGYDAWV